MSDHPTTEDLQDYALGELAPERHADVEAHVQGCVACRREVGETLGLFDQLGALPKELVPLADLAPPEVRVAMGPRERSSLEAEPRGGVVVPGVWSQPAFRIAATIVLVVVGAWALVTFIEVESGEPAVATLPPDDGVKGLTEELAEYRSITDELIARVRERPDADGGSAVFLALASLDRAVLDTERALDDLGEDPVLEQMLVRRYQQRIELLRRTLEVEGAG